MENYIKINENAKDKCKFIKKKEYIKFILNDKDNINLISLNDVQLNKDTDIFLNKVKNTLKIIYSNNIITVNLIQEYLNIYFENGIIFIEIKQYNENKKDTNNFKKYPILYLDLNVNSDKNTVSTFIKYKQKNDSEKITVFNEKYLNLEDASKELIKYYNIFNEKLEDLLKINLLENYIYYNGKLYSTLQKEIKSIIVCNEVIENKIKFIHLHKLLEKGFEIINKKNIVIYECELLGKEDINLINFKKTIFYKLYKMYNIVRNISLADQVDKLNIVIKDIKKNYRILLDELYDNSFLVDKLNNISIVYIYHGDTYTFNIEILEKGYKNISSLIK